MGTDATRRRIRALSVMERVKKLETEEQARETGMLQSRMTTLEAEKKTLLRRLSTQTQNGGVEGAEYLGRFIRSIRAEVERLDTERARLRPELEEAEKRLREKLAEQKTYEILKAARLAELAQIARRNEARALEDIARDRWLAARPTRP